MEEEKMTMQETVENTESVLNALIDYLVEKGVVDEEEFAQKLEECPECGKDECTCPESD